MPPAASVLTLPQRRRALALGHVNAALWAAGNSLTTGSLVSYLARDLGAQGLALSFVLALPNLTGVLRLAAPSLIARAGTARRACLALYSASYVAIIGLPAIAAGVPLVSRRAAVAAMIALLFGHQLLEYLGTVSLWTWWADLVPLAIRGRYFARRQMIQLAVTVPTLLASGYFADQWRERYAQEPDRLLLAYAIPTGVGALCLLASIAPLALMPATRRYESVRGFAWTALAMPFRDARFRRLLYFRAWFSFANGISQTVQNVIYPKEVLGLGVAPMATMRVSMQAGQFAASRPIGKASDRFGNRPLLVAGQLCVSAALLFYIAAGPDTRWLLLGAWILFAAYAAHNICLPNLTLKLAPAAMVSPYVAAGEALGSLLHALATIAGGLAFDWLRTNSTDSELEPLRSCTILLVAGFIMRLVAVPLAAAIQEPNAWTWRQIASKLAGWSVAGATKAPASEMSP
jgi:MFS family permease